MSTLRMDTYMHTETHVDTHKNGMKRPENVLTGSSSMMSLWVSFPVPKGIKMEETKQDRV